MADRAQLVDIKYRAQQFALQDPTLNNALQTVPESVDDYIAAEVTTLPDAIALLSKLVILVQSFLDDETYFPPL